MRYYTSDAIAFSRGNVFLLPAAAAALLFILILSSLFFKRRRHTIWFIFPFDLGYYGADQKTSAESETEFQILLEDNQAICLQTDLELKVCSKYFTTNYNDVIVI